MRRNLTNLKRLFVTFSATKTNDPRYANDTKMSFKDWRNLVRASGMEAVFEAVADTKVTELSARIIFNQVSPPTPHPPPPTPRPSRRPSRGMNCRAIPPRFPATAHPTRPTSPSRLQARPTAAGTGTCVVRPHRR